MCWRICSASSASELCQFRVRACAAWARTTAARIRRHLLARAIDAGARDLPHPCDPHHTVTASQGGRERLAHRLDLLWAKGSGPIKNPTDSNQSRTTVRRGSRGRSPGLPLINSARSSELRKFDSSRRRKLAVQIGFPSFRRHLHYFSTIFLFGPRPVTNVTQFRNSEILL